MSATAQLPLVGDIIEIEHTDDYTATSPVWTIVAHTADTVETAPNTETASIRQHGEFQMDKSAVSEAWEITFSKKILSGVAGLETLGLIGANSELLGSVDTRESNATAPALRIQIYASEADRDTGTVKYSLGTDNYILARGGGEINVEEFALVEMVIHSRARPVRLDEGGTLGGA